MIMGRMVRLEKGQRIIVMLRGKLISTVLAAIVATGALAASIETSSAHGHGHHHGHRHHHHNHDWDDDDDGLVIILG
jgi:hypothetical protein